MKRKKLKRRLRLAYPDPGQLARTGFGFNSLRLQISKVQRPLDATA